jgi:hypothetical protein
MPLESHSAEAKDLLAAVLTVMLYQPQHWYSPSLPQDHPSSFCCLFGLTCEELNREKRGTDLRFQSLVFDDYLQQHQGLSSIKSCQSSHASARDMDYNPKCTMGTVHQPPSREP